MFFAGLLTKTINSTEVKVQSKMQRFMWWIPDQEMSLKNTVEICSICRMVLLLIQKTTSGLLMLHYIRLDDSFINTSISILNFTVNACLPFIMCYRILFKVLKLDKNFKVIMRLGEKMKPGSDNKHFCKPTDVAVARNGHFFVADGYCNSRIMKFDQHGKLLAKFGSPNGI